ncbi:hypothetical protein EJB05_27463, partial [Eragrostis curvula]
MAGSDDARGESSPGADRLSALPDDLPQQRLSSWLPSRSAVRTCVLARRWREQWKSVPAIRITRDDATMYWGQNAVHSYRVTFNPLVILQFIFRRDLTRCNVFSKLKTLLLNEWCFTSHHGALISLVLEKLILQFPLVRDFFDDGNFVEMGARYSLKKQSLILKDLTVEVKCYKVDEWIRKALKVLCSYVQPLEKVKIKRLPMSDEFQFFF